MNPTAFRPFRLPWSFSRQFLAMGAVIFMLGMVVTGSWLARQLELNAVNRAAVIAAAYTESILTVELAAVSLEGLLSAQAVQRLDEIFVDGPLRKKVVRFKLWSADGVVLYSSDPLQRGLRFPVGKLLAAALAGRVQARLTDLDQPDNAPEREHWPQLLEVYVPLRIGQDAAIGGGMSAVSAVAEFYHSTDGLTREIRDAQLHGWQVIAAASLVISLLLWALFRRADETIFDQAHDLRLQLAQLRAALDENERMRGEVSAAGARTTALNEELLLRIAADIHDGPAQKIAYALMRFDDDNETASADRRAAEAIREALRTALVDIRDIASGLGLPLVEPLSLSETVQRAARDSLRQFGLVARTEVDDDIGDAPLAAKITAYRFVQESLNNARVHAPGSMPVVKAWRDGDDAWLEVSDQGQGFDADEPRRAGRLGLAFLRERVRLLGGRFTLETSPGSGTTLRARIPIRSAQHPNEKPE